MANIVIRIPARYEPILDAYIKVFGLPLTISMKTRGACYKQITVSFGKSEFVQEIQAQLWLEYSDDEFTSRETDAREVYLATHSPNPS